MSQAVCSRKRLFVKTGGEGVACEGSWLTPDLEA